MEKRRPLWRKSHWQTIISIETTELAFEDIRRAAIGEKHAFKVYDQFTNCFWINVCFSSVISRNFCYKYNVIIDYQKNS